MTCHFRLFACSTVIVAICVLPGCEQSAGDTNEQSPPTVVIVSPPVEEPVVDAVEYTGRTDSAETVEIRARVTGFLNKVLFKDGAEVAKNAPLYEIDDREFQAQLAAATAELEKANSLQVKTTADFKRTAGLKEKNAVTAQMYDQAESAKREADAAVLAAEAKRDRAQLDVVFSKIDAPIAGKISRSQITAGNLVDANKTVLTTIVSVERMYVYFDVDERTFLTLENQVREGKLESKKTGKIPVFMGLTGEKGYPHAGTLDFVENRINPGTGTIRVRGVFGNPKPPQGERTFEAGMFARVRVPISKAKNALLVTERAIGTDQGQKFLYLVDNKDEVVFRPIQLGAVHDGLRVVTEGLKSGERVIIDGLQRVRPGTIVSPKPGDMKSRPGDAVASVSSSIAAPEPDTASSTRPDSNQKSD